MTIRRSRGLAGILTVGALCAALFACTLAAAGAAKAKAPARGVGSVSLAGVGDFGTAVARCPKGTLVAGGGYGQTPPATAAVNGTTLVDVSGSFRLGKRAWAVRGVQVGGGTSTLTAYAYCRRGLKLKSALVEQTVAAAGRSQATATAECPRGRAVSGGFRKPEYVGGSFTFLTDDEQADGDSWTVTAVRATTAAPVSGAVTSIVYCGKKKVAEVIGSGMGTLATQPATRTIVSSPGCRPSPFAGGVRAPYIEADASLTGRGAFVVTDSRVTGRTWTVAGLALGGKGVVGRSIQVSALAYCN